MVECPPGSDMEAFAQQHGAKIYEFCASREEAERRLRKDPNGKATWELT
jgi:hypothetical protein